MVQAEKIFIMSLLRLCKAVKPMATFHTDSPSPGAGFAAEVYATVRDNGRIVDHVRYALGGDDRMEATFNLELLCEDEEYQDWTVMMQRKPEDIALRKGLLSSNWTDLTASVSSRDTNVFSATGAGIPAGEFLRMAKESDCSFGSTRWAIVLDDSARLAIQLQGLPASAAVLNGRPALKK